MVDRKTVLTNLKNFYEWNFKNYPLNFDEADVIIEALEQPQVVRCKECSHYAEYKALDGIIYVGCDKGHSNLSPNFYCADGEVKNENQ